MVSEEVMERASNGKKPRQRGEGKSLALDQLSDSEHEILELLGRGKSSREIARKLRVSERSVTASRLQIRGKLNFKNAQALCRYAACWVETNGG